MLSSLEEISRKCFFFLNQKSNKRMQFYTRVFAPNPAYESKILEIPSYFEWLYFLRTAEIFKRGTYKENRISFVCIDYYHETAATFRREKLLR